MGDLRGKFENALILMATATITSSIQSTLYDMLNLKKEDVRVHALLPDRFTFNSFFNIESSHLF